MKLYRPDKPSKKPMGEVEDVLRLMAETQPSEGQLIITSWVSPARLSEDDRIRLHQHLIDAHGALSVLTIGLSKTENSKSN